MLENVKVFNVLRNSAFASCYKCKRILFSFKRGLLFMCTCALRIVEKLVCPIISVN